MRSLRSSTVAVVVALLAWSVAALLPLLHVHRAPADDTAPIVLIHLPGEGHVHVAVRDYGHADTWDQASTGSSTSSPHPVDREQPTEHECPACLAATVLAAALLPPTGDVSVEPVAATVRFALPGHAGPLRTAAPSGFQARAPPSV